MRRRDIRRMLLLAPKVELEDMLAARESRAERQRRLLADGGTVVSFTLNVPGDRKRYPLAERAFETGAELIAEQLRRLNAPPLAREERRTKTGCELLLSTGADRETVKRRAVALEEAHPLGRIFDIDVLDREGLPLPGSEYGRGERRCIVCGGPVWECARSRAHSAEQLAERTAETLWEHFASAWGDAVAACATRALLYEVAATPKPGLVDRRNDGAHRDMTIFTFIDSSAALTPFFRRMALTGLEWEDGPAALFPRLRMPGMWAEAGMLRATGGVNTHKGLIFSLGLLCAATGMLAGEGAAEFAAERVLELCGAMASDIPAELTRPENPENAEPTHGEVAFKRFGIQGARGEAARGYPDVLTAGLPEMRKRLAAGASLNDAGVAALLGLMAKAEDTNIVSRSDVSTLKRTQARAGGMLERAGQNLERLLAEAEELDREFIEKNLSPGGSADLLALCYMLVFLEDIEAPFAASRPAKA